MRVLSAFGVALRRALGAWRAVVGAYALNLVLAVTLGWLVYTAIGASLGSSLAGVRMHEGFDPHWYNSFSAQATGVAATFRPTVNGKGAVFDAVDAFFDGFLWLIFGPDSSLLPLALVYLVAWSFLSGGFIARFAGAPAGSFLVSARRHLFPMLGVTVVGLVAVVLVLGPLRASLDARIAAFLRESIDERDRFAWTVAEYLLLWTIVWWTRVVVDYAKVATVLRGGSALPAAVAGVWRALTIVARHPVRTCGLHATIGVLWLVTLAIYVAIVPGTTVSSTWGVVGAFVLGQAWILSRVFIRALLFAGATVTAVALGPADVADTSRVA